MNRPIPRPGVGACPARPRATPSSICCPACGANWSAVRATSTRTRASCASWSATWRSTPPATASSPRRCRAIPTGTRPPRNTSRSGRLNVRSPTASALPNARHSSAVAWMWTANTSSTRRRTATARCDSSSSNHIGSATLIGMTRKTGSASMTLAHRLSTACSSMTVAAKTCPRI